jgi:hypothetical protein
MYMGAERPAAASAISSVTVTCPGRLSAEPAIVHIRERGNLPLLIGDQVLAELTQNDLVESWDTACALPIVELSKMCKIAGERLARAMEERIEFADLPELVVDAAVLFLLAIKRYGIRSPEDIPACSVSYDVARGQEVVVLPA